MAGWVHTTIGLTVRNLGHNFIYKRNVYVAYSAFKGSLCIYLFIFLCVCYPFKGATIEIFWFGFFTSTIIW